MTPEEKRLKIGPRRPSPSPAATRSTASMATGAIPTTRRSAATSTSAPASPVSARPATVAARSSVITEKTREAVEELEEERKGEVARVAPVRFYFAATIRAMTFGSSGSSPTFARRGGSSRNFG